MLALAPLRHAGRVDPQQADDAFGQRIVVAVADAADRWPDSGFGHLEELYGIEVSPDLVSTVSYAVLDDIATWQARSLEPIYPLVFFDALRVKIWDEGLVRNQAVHIALGVRADGTKEILGLWLEQNEGTKFWLRVMNELRNRGVENILLAVVDGLKSFPKAIRAAFP